ncbi:MAG: DUF87 domain-containing protein, partial [Pseudanabaena sp. M074S1SP2A07QC]|nr:DUF87 domain-containing protein [Pseudanabaena sp. M074S1SP2A07QC]
NHIYLGVCTQDEEKEASVTAKGVEKFFKGNWKGIKIRQEIDAYDKIEKLFSPLDSMSVLTGIPSLKHKNDNDQASTQSIDRLLTGMRGSRFAYIVSANPIQAGIIDEILDFLRLMQSTVKSFGKQTVTEANVSEFTQSVGIEVSNNNQDSLSYTTGESYAETETKSTDLNIAETKTTKVFAGNGGISASRESSITASFSIAKSNSKTKTSSTEKTKTFITSMNENLSKNTTETNSLTKSSVREFVSEHALSVEKTIDAYIERFEQASAMGGWDVGVYILAENLLTTDIGAMQIKALLSGKSTYHEPIRIHAIDGRQVKVFKEKLLKYWRIPFPLSISHPLGRTFSSLTTPLTTDELSLLANFPRREIPGIKVLPMADFSMNPHKSDGFKLGNILDGGEPVENLHYRIDLSVLNKHVLIAGITGSGKTTTCTQLLQQLLDIDIPFLIIEPAKSEYVDWARSQNLRGKKIAIYALGNKDSEEKLELNPFNYVSQDYVLSHIDRLKAILSAVFPMQEVLPLILENLLIKAYTEKKCIDADDKPSDIPDIAFLLDILDSNKNDDVIDPSYEPRFKGNITASLRTRLKSLQIGWKKDLFAQKTTDWKDLFDRPVVINLSQLGDDNDKALVVSTLLLFLHEYRQIQHKQNQSSKSELRHVTVLEEAHCILQKTSEVNFEQANPKGKVAEMFSNMLSEIRAYGEGMVIIDQVPSRLIPDAIKNTNLKILHRIVAADDREAMSACMSLTPEQSKIIGILRPGQAIIHGDLDDMASWVKIEKQKSWAI